MKKSIIQIIFASLLLISFISCNPGVNPDSKQDSDQNSNQDSNIKPFALDLSQFPQPENDMGTYNTKTHVLSIDDKDYLQKECANLYYWLNYLDASEYNCVRIKYNSPEYGFVVAVQDDNEKVLECYLPSYLTEFVLPLNNTIDTKKLRGLYFLAGFGNPKQTIKLKEITFEYVENVTKTDVWATNHSPVKDTALQGSFDDTISSWDFVKKLGVGINFVKSATAGTTYEMGHDFYGMGDGYGHVKKELITSIKNRGFSTIRLMVGNGYHMLDENYTIDPEFLEEIKQIADWAIEEGLYVIITDGNHYYGETDNAYISVMKNNVHYAGYTITASASTDIQEKSKKFLAAVWKQMAAAFNNSYDEHLIFELMNEPHDSYHQEHKFWEQPDCPTCAANMKLLNEYTQLCLDTIRDSGGNNAKRFILVPGLGTYWKSITCEHFTFPTDTAENADKKLIPVVHAYPQNNVKPYTNEAYPGEGNWIKTENITKLFALLDEAFFSKNIPVYISETGVSIESPGRMDCMRDFCTEAKKTTRSCSFTHHDDSVIADETNKETGPASFFLYDKYSYEWAEENKDYLDMIFDSMKNSF